MYLARILLHKLKSREDFIRSWFLEAAQVDDIDSPGLSGEKIQISITRGELVDTVKLSDSDIILILEELGATEIVWDLCNFHSADFSLDSLLRDFVCKQIGLRLEDVPFCYHVDGLTTMCSYEECAGNPQQSDQVAYDIGGGAISVLLPWDSEDLRELLMERLRRISA